MFTALEAVREAEAAQTVDEFPATDHLSLAIEHLELAAAEDEGISESLRERLHDKAAALQEYLAEAFDDEDVAEDEGGDHAQN